MTAENVKVEFEWDPKKNESNIRDHGVDFAEAMTIFDWEHYSLVDDTEEAELQQRTFGQLASGMLLCVIHSQRGSAIRIISARKASKMEGGEYNEYIRRTLG